MWYLKSNSQRNCTVLTDIGKHTPFKLDPLSTALPDDWLSELTNEAIDGLELDASIKQRLKDRRDRLEGSHYHYIARRWQLEGLQFVKSKPIPGVVGIIPDSAAAIQNVNIKLMSVSECLLNCNVTVP